MKPTSLLAPGGRVVDVGPTDAGLARALVRAGRQRYLGLVLPEHLEAVRRDAGDLAHRFQPWTVGSQAYRNNADLLVLHPPFVQPLWVVSAVRHSRHVALVLDGRRPSAEATAAIALGTLRGKFRPLGRITCGSQRLLVLRTPGRRPLQARQYLSPVWGVEGLVARSADLDYVVLRWFEQLPHVDPGEDLDVLVADEDLEAMRSLLAREPGTVPVDLYSASGLPGADYHGVAYYPPALARDVLRGAERHRTGCKVPAPTDHLRSLAYHAVYHKGLASGLASKLYDADDVDGVPAPDHDYAGVLGRLADEVGVDLEPTLEAVDAFLDDAGWRPSLDTLRRLARTNPWITRRFLSEPARDASEGEPETVAFLLREQTLSVLAMEEVVRELDHMGFDVLAVRPLDAAARRRCEAHTRGGNWARGRFPRSGGGPAVMVVALHHGPMAPRPAVKQEYPYLTNMDVLLLKRRIRDMVVERLDPAEQFNAIHSSDNEAEAWEYITLALDDEAAELRIEVDRRRERYRGDRPVLRPLSRGRRSRVEVVDGTAGPVVRKTFADGYRRHMLREVEGIRALAPCVPAVPELLEVGSNWFTTPYYENVLGGTGRDGRLVPLPAVREMVRVLRSIHALGYDVVDAKPENFLLDPHRGLKLVDLEFLHRYSGESPDFARSYSFVGVPSDFGGDVPFRWSYDWSWYRSTGLSRTALVGDDARRQQLERAWFRLRHALTGRRSVPRRGAREARDRVRSARVVVRDGYARWAQQRLDRAPDPDRGSR